MYKSERMMKAIGDISDDKIEKAACALGYQKARRQTSRIPIRMGRLLSIAAVLALILALGTAAYAANLFGLRELYANPNRGDMPEEAADLIVSQSAEAEGDGWSASVQETYCDEGTVLVAAVRDRLVGQGNAPRVCPRKRENAFVRGGKSRLGSSGTSFCRRAF